MRINSLAFTAIPIENNSAAVRKAKRLTSYFPPVRDPNRVFAIVIPHVPIGVFDLALTGSPRVFVPPFRPHPAVAEVAAHVVAGHLERIFPNRSRCVHVKPIFLEFCGLPAEPTRLALQKSRNYKLVAQADAEQVPVADEVSDCAG